MSDQRNNTRLNRFSSTEEKDGTAEIVYEVLGDFLFNQANLINGTFAVSGANTSTSQYKVGLRVPDTSSRMFMSPDRKLRFRCTFYVSGTAEKADLYILTPAVLTDLTAVSGGLITNISSLDSYVGIRFNAGEVSLVSKGLGTTVSKGKSNTITSDKTYYLEVLYNITNAEFYLNKEYLGTLSCNLQDSLYTYEAFYPLIAPIKSLDGTSVNLNMESYQILQDK